MNVLLPPVKHLVSIVKGAGHTVVDGGTADAALLPDDVLVDRTWFDAVIENGIPVIHNDRALPAGCNSVPIYQEINSSDERAIREALAVVKCPAKAVVRKPVVRKPIARKPVKASVKRGVAEPPVVEVAYKYDVLFISVELGIGAGGGQLSLFAMAAELRMRGYRVDITSAGAFQSDRKEGEDVSAKVYVVVSGALTAGLVEALPVDGKRIIVINNITSKHFDGIDWGKWDAVLCNSEFTMRTSVNDGAENVFVDKPVLWEGAARVKTRIPNGGVLLMEYSSRKGSEIFNALAECMPETPFVGVSNAQEPEERGNVNIIPFTASPFRLYEKAAVVIAPNRPSCPETYGRVTAEAVANGIPVVASRVGNAVEWKKLYPSHVSLCPPRASVKQWKAAVKRAMRTTPEPVPELWKRDHPGLLAALDNLGIAPTPGASYVIGNTNGIGDAVTFSAVARVLSRAGTVYHWDGARKIPRVGKSVFSMCPHIIEAPAPLDAIHLNSNPVDHNDTPDVWVTEQRHLSYERRCMAAVDEWTVDWCWDTDTMQKVAGMLPVTRRKHIGVAFNSGVHWPMKTMPLDHQRIVVDALVSTGKYEVILIAAAQTLGDGYRVHDFGGETTPEEAIHLTSLMDGYVGVDTGISHVAASCRVPSVVIMGPVGVDRHIQFTIWGGKVLELCMYLPCQPCWRGAHYGCDAPAKCLRMEPKKVLDALEEVLP